MINLNITPGSTDTGNGIDVTSVVNQILDSERQPEVLLQQQLAKAATQNSALNSVKTGLATLQDKVNDLKDVLGAFSAMTANSSNTAILTAAAQSGVQAGNHVVVVQNLVSTSSYYTDSLPDAATTFATGTLTVQIGSGAGSSSVDIKVDNSNNTLNTLISYINAQNLGVSASVIQDANGSRLALVSKTAGSSGDLTVTANSTGLVFHKSSIGQNASLTIDGVPISSASNTVSGAIPGVTLNLAAAAPGTPVVVSVAPDTAQAEQAINHFVSSYNSVITAINRQFAYDDNTQSAGPLAGNSTLRSLQTSLLADIAYSIPGNNGLVSLRSIGVNMEDDGTLSVDNAKLSDVLSNQFADVKNLFQSVTQNGLARHFSSDLGTVNDSTQGILSLSLNELTNTQAMLRNSINDFEDRLTERQKYLVNEYSRIDTMLRQFPLIMQQITGQLGTLSSK